ncbi:Cupin domain-containing protein [Cladophialophora immunda]|nr:Cupin domain-containing protein [Cladophialophora immunda]
MTSKEVASAVEITGGLPPPLRYITTHRPDGKSVFSNEIPAAMPAQPIRPDVDFFLAYTSSNFPVQLGAEGDIQNYRTFLEGAKPGLIIKGGTVLRICDYAPGGPPAIMHRTMSLDYGIVLAGEVECLLDSGEKRHLKTGDVVIQRQTNHAWVNASKDKWARMIFILQEAEPLTIGSSTLAEDYGEIEGVKPSS